MAVAFSARAGKPAPVFIGNCLLLLLALVAGVAAQERYPARPVRLIVPFATGGPGDILARSLSGPMSEALGQSVIVDNRPGGDAVPGTELAARSPADGYWLMQVSTTQAINMLLKEKVGYDLLRDFTPVGKAVTSTLVLVTASTSSFRTVAELVSYAKAQPGGVSYASGATGSVGHLSAELFKRATGVSALHVPYKGTGAAIPDVIGARVEFFFANQAESVIHVGSGHLRALAVTARQRVPTFPDTPTMIELGFKDFDPSTFYGYMVPRGTPAPIVQRLYDALARAVQSQAVQSRLATLGMTSALGGADDLSALIRSELSRWGPVIRSAGIRAE